MELEDQSILWIEGMFKLQQICRVGQNRIYTPYIAVYLVISLP